MVSSAGAAAAAASAAIAANNARLVSGGEISAGSIWVNAFAGSFLGVMLVLLFWVILKDDHPWQIRVIFYMCFGMGVLFSFSLPAVFVLWLCGLLA